MNSMNFSDLDYTTDIIESMDLPKPIELSEPILFSDAMLSTASSPSMDCPPSLFPNGPFPQPVPMVNSIYFSTENLKYI